MRTRPGPWLVIALAVLVVGRLSTGFAAQSRPWPPGLQSGPADTTPLSPEASMATFFMPPGYGVELVAAEPLIQDVVAIDWDADGRLWAVEMPGYMPDLDATGEKDPIGRVVILEDVDDDGVMDRRTVFADGLVLARAIKVLVHGVLVGEPPDLWLMRDLDGDLRADVKERVTDRYGRREANVEHNANSLFWALDNWIYTSEVDTDLRVTRGTFEIRRTLSQGQWGVTQDDAGRLYRNTNESSLHVDTVPAWYYTRHPTLLRTRGSYESLEGPNREVNRIWPVRPTPGVNRGYQTGVLREDGSLRNFTAVATPTVFRGDRLPAELYGNVFVVEPAGNLVSRIIVENGEQSLEARKAYEGAEFLASTDERFRPVYLSSAPDGTLYIVDMYRGIIQHKGYVTEYLHEHIVSHELAAPTGYGRIYRVVHESTVRDRRPAMSAASAADLVATLSHANGWRRDMAQQLLVQRGDRSVASALGRLVEGAADWRVRLHALWTLDGLDSLDRSTIVGALADPSRDVRVSALRLAERWFAEPDPIVERAVLARLDDGDWQVRQQLAATLGEMVSDAGLPAMVTVLERYGDDPVVMDATLSGLRGREATAIARLLSGDETPRRAAALTMLAATIVRGAQDGGVQELFGQIADADRPEWQRDALLAGAEVALAGARMPGTTVRRGTGPGPGAAPAPCPTCPGGRAGPGGARAFPGALDEPEPEPEPGAVALAEAVAALVPPRGGRGGRGGGGGLRLNREPALVSLAASGVGDLSARATAVLERVEWPGKPGAAAPVRPLTAAEEARFEAGREVYANVCAACHQTDGRGRPELAPSLVGSGFALGPADLAAQLLMAGKEGPVGLMPPLGATLSDEQVAAVLTYIRREWGQAGSPVETGTVTEARAATAGRSRPWTDAELLELAAASLPAGPQD